MPRRVATWDDIPDGTIRKFEKAVEKLRKQMVPCDFDGDPAVDIVIIDRRKCQSFHYEPIPYHHKLDRLPEDKREQAEDEIERWLAMNMKIASNELGTWLEIKRLARFRKSKPEPPQNQIIRRNA